MRNETKLLVPKASLLQMRGYSVCIIEKDMLEGRTQEWNVNDHEIQASGH